MTKGRKPVEVLVDAQSWGLDINSHGNSTRNFLKQLTAEDLQNIAYVWLGEKLRSIHRQEVRRTEVKAERTRPAPYVAPLSMTDEQFAALGHKKRTPEEVAAQEREWKENAERRRLQLEKEIQEREAARHQSFRDALNDYAMAKHIEWTDELLASDFTLSDGTRVTWGDATIDQHFERQRMFQHNVMANAEGASRHAAAIRDLQASGASTLRGMRQGVAA